MWLKPIIRIRKRQPTQTEASTTRSTKTSEYNPIAITDAVIRSPIKSRRPRDEGSQPPHFNISRLQFDSWSSSMGPVNEFLWPIEQVTTKMPINDSLTSHSVLHRPTSTFTASSQLLLKHRLSVLLSLEVSSISLIKIGQNK